MTKTIYALSSGAAFNFNDEAPDDVLVLGYSSLSEEKISAAVRVLASVVASLMEQGDGAEIRRSASG